MHNNVPYFQFPYLFSRFTLVEKGSIPVFIKCVCHLPRPFSIYLYLLIILKSVQKGLFPLIQRILKYLHITNDLCVACFSSKKKPSNNKSLVVM